jgi:hypothetical protein
VAPSEEDYTRHLTHRQILSGDSATSACRGPAPDVSVAASVAQVPGSESAVAESPAKGKRRLGNIPWMMAITGVLVVGASLGISAFSNSDTSNRISATLKCPIPGRNPESVSKAVAYHVGPAPCDYATMGDICRTVIMTEMTCNWEGLELGGEPVTDSLWHGQGYTEGDGVNSIVTSGYDWGVTASGDNYLSRWTEIIAPDLITAEWTIVFGTGSLQGIVGEAAIVCDPPPGPTDKIEVCSVTGSYSL